jgi:hypothetical protein
LRRGQKQEGNRCQKAYKREIAKSVAGHVDIPFMEVGVIQEIAGKAKIIA